MRSFLCISAALIGLMLMVMTPALAHHSIPAFWDESKSIEINGTVKLLKVVNPHSELVVEVTAPNGQRESWLGVGGTATGMIKAGWSNETLKVGVPIKVEGAPPRKVGAKGILIRKITMADGRVLTTGRID